LVQDVNQPFIQLNVDDVKFIIINENLVAFNDGLLNDPKQQLLMFNS